MTPVQKETIEYLESLGYEVIHKMVWPIMRNPKTGVMMQVAMDGSQRYLGVDKRD